MPAEAATAPFNWKEPFPPEKSATNPNFDHLGTLPGQAQRLQDFVLQNFKEKTNPSLTVGLEAPWGSGKTNFLNGWVRGMRAQGHVVVHFNAWETSFASDPLEAFLIGLLKETKEYQTIDAEKVKAFIGSILSSKIVVGGINTALNLATSGGWAAMQSSGLISTITDSFNTLADAVEQLDQNEIASKFITEQARHNAMTNILSGIMVHDTFKSKPLIFVIDELDRCPPAYAMQVLERIRHVMAVNQTVFILGYDREQLEDFIGHTQGTRDTGRRGDYLTRFIQRRWPLQKPNPKQTVPALFKEFGINELLPPIYRKSENLLTTELITFLIAVFTGFNASIREQRRILSHYSSVLVDYQNSEKNNENLQDLFTPWLAIIGLLLRHYAYHTGGMPLAKLEVIEGSLKIQNLGNNVSQEVPFNRRVWETMTSANLLYKAWKTFKPGQSSAISGKSTDPVPNLHNDFHQRLQMQDREINKGELKQFLLPNKTDSDFIITDHPLVLSAIDDLIDGAINPN